MNNQTSKISRGFLTFRDEAPKHAQAWNNLIQNLSKASAFDAKTGELIHISLLAALRINSGIPFHVKSAKNIGATREEIISAILAGLPLAGNIVTQALPSALDAFDE
ncbi:MAG: carboxymuconolactone decarboxylase family protein [Candidatus Hodarchaeales archaeon]